MNNMNGKTATLIIRYAEQLSLPDKGATRKLKKQWKRSNAKSRAHERIVIRTTIKRTDWTAAFRRRIKNAYQNYVLKPVNE
jgi:hypothetical protein